MTPESDWVDSNHPATLATNFVYNAAGAVTSVEYGNGTLYPDLQHGNATEDPGVLRCSPKLGQVAKV